MSTVRDEEFNNLSSSQHRLDSLTMIRLSSTESTNASYTTDPSSLLPIRTVPKVLIKRRPSASSGVIERVTWKEPYSQPSWAHKTSSLFTISLATCKDVCWTLKLQKRLEELLFIGRNIGQDGGRAYAFRSQWRPKNIRKWMEIRKLSKI